jgi:lysine-specific demethylase 8
MNTSAVATHPATDADLSLRHLNEAGRRAYLALFFCEHFLGPQLCARVFGKARQRNRESMLAYLSDWPQNERKPVREVAFTSHEEFYASHVRDWEPAVFRGIARQWPAVGRWNLEFFARNYAGTVAVIGDQHGLYGDGETGRYEISTLGRIVTAIHAGQKQCLRFSPIIDENPGLKDDLDMRWLEGFRSRFSVRGLPQFFLAPAATFTPMHCALECNVFVQIHGKKRWILYPAMYQPLLEPPADRRVYFRSDVRPDRPSPQFALAPYAPAFEVVLNAGDVMYIPPFAWHHVENVTDTIAVGYRFNSLRTALRTAWPMTILRFLATKPTVFRTLYQTVVGTNFLYKPQVQ